MSSHAKVLHGLCPVCGHYGEDCTGLAYTKEERAAIIHAVKAVLVATAELWDVLRDAELGHEEELGAPVEIEYSDDLIGVVAGDMKKPPSFQDISDDEVWESFLQYSEVKVYRG